MPGSPSDASDRVFPPTAWTIVLVARDSAAPETLAAREELCRTYWRPVASYLCALGMTVPNAEDGAQEVMVNLFSKDGLRQFDRERGRLRHYLKSAARHFLFNQHRAATAQKRGGGNTALPLDELPDSSDTACSPEPDSAFDKEWAITLCNRAMRSLDESYARRNKAELLAALKPGLIFNDGLQPFAQIGLSFGVTEAQIRIEIHRMRRRLAEFLRAEVAGTLGPDATSSEIDEETRYLVKTLAYEFRG